MSISAQDDHPTPESGIVYVNPGAATIPVKPYAGTRYRDTVPDTYDIAERAALAVNALVGSTDPRADHELYWKVTFARNPVVMSHDWNDWCQVKFMEALPLLRIASGSTRELQVDQAWQDLALKSLGPDGLFYVPLRGRPWALLSSCWAEGAARADGTLTNLGDPGIEQITHPFVNGRMLGTLLVHWLRDGNPAWLDSIRRMVDRLSQLTIDLDDCSYFPALVYEPGAVYDRGAPSARMPIHILGGEINARLPESLGRAWRLTGYEPARILAERIARYVVRRMEYWGPDGEFLAERHFHAHTIYLLGLLELAAATGDRDGMAFVRRGYEWAKTGAAGSVDSVGFFPEVATTEWPSAESCEIADMISLALRLSAAGVGDYWGDAERWTRNHFAEAQLTDPAWVDAQAAGLPVTPVAANECAERAAERNTGAFAQGSSGNEFWAKGPDGIVHCCTGNAARTLYDLWRHAVAFREGTLSVNLLLNHASRWADVHSFIPWSGRVEVRPKRDCGTLLVHAPSWIATGATGPAATVDGSPRGCIWRRRFLDLGAVAAGRIVRIDFPIADHGERATMGTKDYRLDLRGDTVVRVDPPGKIGALYQREHFRAGQPRMREVTRFVSDETLEY
jgi:hypothetical protein